MVTHSEICMIARARKPAWSRAQARCMDAQVSQTALVRLYEWVGGTARTRQTCMVPSETCMVVHANDTYMIAHAKKTRMVARISEIRVARARSRPASQTVLVRLCSGACRIVRARDLNGHVTRRSLNGSAEKRDLYGSA
ncbi:unnamed protein product [Cercopithifilaria johnstoni]|uniref:Uncharacterized protein n=1 Tax=Cercopithifilaria johnstoni TaxID=2874296 RepID=A0A8J2M3I2_9BILA|nr:unnamed protein product [Cercopithifilaria johnstoni]